MTDEVDAAHHAQIEALAERLIAIIRDHRRDSPKPTVVHELHDVIAQQRDDARDEALHEVEVWLGPVLEQLERETAAQLAREPAAQQETVALTTNSEHVHTHT